MLKRLVVLLCALVATLSTMGQSYNITGHIVDAKDSSHVIGATVVVRNGNDTTQKTGAVSDAKGNFEVDGLAAGNYTVHIENIGYSSVNKTVSVVSNNVNMGTISMRPKSSELKGVTIEGKQIRAEQNGDTTSFHADAYKTNPDATAEDLVTKMPGVTSDNTGVKVNGEAVQQVYVNGKPFFGQDATLALRNFPAEVIDKIQVFDQLSDQANFTGFDDGNAQKSMNIITKPGKSDGTFGKVYAGGGTDDTYIAGGNYNIFDGNQRISIIALSNNINQQNFGSQDVLGVTGGSGGGRGGGGGGGASNFMVNQQPGITTTNSYGINYSDVWGAKKNVQITASYFYNSTDNSNTTDLVRNYFTGSQTGSAYYENDNTQAVNYNQRFNMRLVYTIDSSNAIYFTPSLNYQENSTNELQLAYTDSVTMPISKTVNTNGAYYYGYTSSNNLLLQHKFHKKRRTLSLNINSSLNEKAGNGYYSADDSEYTAALADTITSTLNQHYNLYSNGYTVGGNLAYTEPIGEKSQLMVNYYPSYTWSTSNKVSNNYDPATGKWDIFDDTLSNNFNSTYTTQKGGLSYRVGDKKFSLSFGANYQYSVLEGEQIYPYAYTVRRYFGDVLPIGFFNYKFPNGKNLRVYYHANITAPSVSQLQDVVNVSNPLLLNGGNPNLRQDYEQTLLARYGQTRKKSQHNLFLFFYVNYINNYIGNATLIPTRDSLYQGPLNTAPVKIERGGQLTLPVNLNGYLSEKTFITYAMPADWIKSNLNLTAGVNYTRSPGEVNNVINYSDNPAPTGGIVLSSNVSPELDFTLSYNGTYNFVTNTLSTQADNNYYMHTAAFKINWIFKKHFVVNTNITQNYYTAFSNTGNQNYFLWNGYLAYKLLKKQALEVRLSAFDILKENKAITRTVTGTYIENDVTNVLQQYFMFQLTYTIRNFKGQLPQEGNDRDNNFPGGGGGGHWHGNGGGMNGSGGPGGGGMND